MSENTKVKEIPSSKESEMMVLGCMLTSINALNIAADGLDDGDFYYTEHKIIFQSLKTAYKNDKPADVHLVCEDLRSQDKLKNVGGAAYVTTLAQYAGTSAYIEEYVKNVRNKALLRSMISAARKVEKMALDEPEDVQAALENSSMIFEELKQNGRLGVEESYFRYLLNNNSEKLLIEEMKNISPGVNTGFTIGDVDLKIPGGALSVIALPTGHGKTTLLINCSIGVLKHQCDKSVYFFTYEENEASIISYFLNTWIGKDLSKNNRGSIKDYFRHNSTEYIRAEMRDEFMRGKNSFFKNLTDNGRLRIFYTYMVVEELINSIRFIKKNTNVGLICIDYIQCLRLKQFQGNRQEQLKEISLMLKDVAVETGLPILLGAQFNREVLCEGDISPTRIREAADIEHIANLVIGGWNRNYNGFSRDGNKGKDNKQIPIESAIYLEIMKGRETGNGHNSVLDFNGNIGKLENRRKSDQNQIFG